MRGINGRWGRVVTAMVTPFDESGAVDTVRAGELAQYLLAHGSDTLVINGTTGESPTTSGAEKFALVQSAVRAVGGSKVIAGVGGNDTRRVVETARQAHDAGAGALLAVAPYYNKPSQEGLYRHFRAVAEATPLPVILYNVPTRTITNIDADTTARLAKDAPNIVATKEASANFAQVAEIARLTPETFDIYSGDDATILPTLALGGAGVVSVISHLCGETLQEAIRAWFAGDLSESNRLFLPTLPVTRAVFSAPSPAPLKYALAKVGQGVGNVRLPLVELIGAEETVVDAALKSIGLL
ncbi:MAG: 4-hydroxy-tetrahydrodipicolinate synthase [Armatimonadetes bacterium]|nr:4-hydroxy-tetrahydrodipicolinate synthase [Armatimonadota bacterium]